MTGRRTIRSTYLLLSSVGGLAAALSASANDAPNPHYDWAQVLSRTPVYEEVRVVTPRTECWIEEVVYETKSGSGRPSATPMIVGATVGGLLGNEIGGKGKSKKVGTVVGAVLGGSIGHDIARQHHRKTRVRREVRDEERCETRSVVTWEEELAGYDVRYRYRGREYETRTAEDPGEQLRVAIHVSPAP